MKHVSDEFIRSPSGGVDENKSSAGGPVSPNQTTSPSNGAVPSPPDQTALPRKPTVAAGLRRDSDSTVGTDDTAIAISPPAAAGAADEESAVALQMHRRNDGRPMPDAGSAGASILPHAPELRTSTEKR